MRQLGKNSNNPAKRGKGEGNEDNIRKTVVGIFSNLNPHFFKCGLQGLEDVGNCCARGYSQHGFQEHSPW